MDDVDQALHSPIPLTEEQIQFIFTPEFEWCDEKWMVAGIKKYLRTPKQKMWMEAFDYSIEDMLNGRIEGEFAQANCDIIFAQWNDRLGRKVFG